jgi:hypothetical protein
MVRLAADDDPVSAWGRALGSGAGDDAVSTKQPTGGGEQ